VIIVLVVLLLTRQRFGSSAARGPYHLLTCVIGGATLLRAIVSLLLYLRTDYSLCITAAAAICSKCCDFFVVAALLYTDARKSTHGLLIGSLNTPFLDPNTVSAGVASNSSSAVPTCNYQFITRFHWSPYNDAALLMLP
jgi:hypothetical protein